MAKNTKLRKRVLTPLRKLSLDQLVFAGLVLALIGTWTIYVTHAATLPGEYGSVEVDQLTRINQARGAAGVAPVTLTHINCLHSIAAGWAQQMAAAGGISHNPAYSGSIDGACGGYWSSLGENVGIAYSSDQLFGAFMNSPQHKANILNPNYSRVGIGAYFASNGSLWVTQDFGGCADCSGGWNTPAAVPADPQPPQPQYATISGRVTVNGSGVSGATIYLCNTSGGNNGYVATDANGNWSYRITTFSNFCARIVAGAPTGSFGPTASNNPEYSSATSYEWQLAGGACYHNTTYCGNGKIGGNDAVINWDRNADSGYNFAYTKLALSAPATGSDRLLPGQTLSTGQYIKSSDNRDYLVMQSDGNAVIYPTSGGAAVWSSRTWNSGTSVLTFQGDGNLVVYKRTGGVCHSGTYGRGGKVVIMQGDGNLVIYGSAGAIWSSRYNTWYC